MIWNFTWFFSAGKEEVKGQMMYFYLKCARKNCVCPCLLNVCTLVVCMLVWVQVLGRRLKGFQLPMSNYVSESYASGVYKF